MGWLNKRKQFAVCGACGLTKPHSDFPRFVTPEGIRPGQFCKVCMYRMQAEHDARARAERDARIAQQNLEQERLRRLELARQAEEAAQRKVMADRMAVAIAKAKESDDAALLDGTDGMRVLSIVGRKHLGAVEEKLKWDLANRLNGMGPWTSRLPVIRLQCVEVIQSSLTDVMLELTYAWGEHGWGAFVGVGDVEEHDTVQVYATFKNEARGWRLVDANW